MPVEYPLTQIMCHLKPSQLQLLSASIVRNVWQVCCAACSAGSDKNVPDSPPPVPIFNYSTSGLRIRLFNVVVLSIRLLSTNIPIKIGNYRRIRQ